MLKKNFSIMWLVIRYGIEKYLLKNFRFFAPSSAGNYKILGGLTKKNIDLIFPLMSRLLFILKFKIKIISAISFSKINNSKNNVKILKKYFNKYGSDKSKIHNYHLIYASLFKKNNKIKNILEIGLGTNNEDLVSNMGKYGHPGASIRAFRDFFTNANIFGIDIDNKILFKENRIKTFYGDQTNISNLIKIYKKINKKFDLIIDDGLHISFANLSVIISSLRYVKKNGYLIIEDIPFGNKYIWEVIGYILHDKYNNFIVKSKKCFVFVIKN